MRNSKMWILVTMTVVAILVASCSQPQEALDAARAAYSEAQSLEPSTYAPEAWAAAEQAMEAADAEIAAQADKFALFRSYDQAEELIATAETAANAARDAATAGREAAREAAEAALSGAAAAVESARTALDELAECRRKPKGFAADHEQLTGLADGLEAQLSEVDSLLAAEEYLGAQTLAESLLAEAEALVSDLAEAKTRLGC